MDLVDRGDGVAPSGAVGGTSGGSAGYLRSLPPLGPRRSSDTGPCKLCGAATEPFCAIDFNTACNDPGLFEPAGLSVPYVRCVACGCLFTRFCDQWTSADFADLIYNDQYILVDGEYDGTRATRDAAFMAEWLNGAREMRLLDYGSGLGHFAVAMRAHGFRHVESYDPFAHPERPTGRFDIVTSFETIEHSADPVGTFRDMLSLMVEDGCLLIGQTLQPLDIEEIGGRWWYLGPRNGHITTFAHETIRAFAEREGLVFESFGGLFALSRPERRAYLAGLLSSRALADGRAMLFAPGPHDAPPPGWHGPEAATPTQAFRWTGAAEIALGELVVERETLLVIPFNNLIRPDFVEDCRVRIGDAVLPLRRRPRELVAGFVPDSPGTFTVTLLTPAPQTPPQGSGDDRALGVAILSAPYPPPLNPIRANVYRG